MNARRNTALPWFAHNTKQFLQPVTSGTEEHFKVLGCSCAWAGQMGGAIHLSLTFLLLFLSRKKEEGALERMNRGTMEQMNRGTGASSAEIPVSDSYTSFIREWKKK